MTYIVPLLNSKGQKSQVTLEVWTIEKKVSNIYSHIGICIRLIEWFHELFGFQNVSWKISFIMSEEKKKIEYKTCMKNDSCFYPKYVNSGMTMFYNTQKKGPFEIFIWRKEEGWKVFIHECLHALDLDRICKYTKQNQLDWYKTIPLKPISWFLPEEGIVEISACLIHSCFSFPMFYTKQKEDVKISTWKEWIEKIQMEQIYVHYQLIQMLQLYPIILEQFYNDLPIQKRIPTHSSLFGYYFVRSLIYFQWNLYHYSFLKYLMNPISTFEFPCGSIQFTKEWKGMLYRIDHFTKNKKIDSTSMSMRMTLLGSSF
jgi:hypothetical protein